jgi:uncharacterized membrane protein YdbT with pleckstrin-like domain
MHHFKVKAKLFKRNVLLWVTIVAIVAVVGVAFAAVQFTWQISNTVTIKSDYSLQVRNKGETALVTSIDWGEHILNNT